MPYISCVLASSLGQVDDLGRRRLELEGEFVAGDAGLQLGVAGPVAAGARR